MSFREFVNKQDESSIGNFVKNAFSPSSMRSTVAYQRLSKTNNRGYSQLPPPEKEFILFIKEFSPFEQKRLIKIREGIVEKLLDKKLDHATIGNIASNHIMNIFKPLKSSFEDAVHKVFTSPINYFIQNQ